MDMGEIPTRLSNHLTFSRWPLPLLLSLVPRMSARPPVDPAAGGQSEIQVNNRRKREECRPKRGALIVGASSDTHCTIRSSLAGARKPECPLKHLKYAGLSCRCCFGWRSLRG